MPFRTSAPASAFWCGALLVTMLAGAATAALAGGTSEFRTDSVAEVLEGETEGLSISAEGALLPAPALRELLSGEPSYVWSLVPDGRGGVYAATGSDGHLYHVAADGTSEVAAETFEYELFALTQAADGSLLFAGAPNGTVTRLDADGDSETVIDLPEGLVWDLVVGPDGELYAATGDRGEIYRVDAEGETTSIGSVPDAHAVCLAWKDGRLLCGTDSRGLLVALDPQSGNYEVLYDAAEDEIVAILLREDGSVLFAANGESADESESEGGMSMEVSARGTGPALYERLPSGLVRLVWRCSGDDILDLCRAPDGRILVGTGSDGVLFALDSLWNATRLIDFQEAQVLALAADGEQVFVGTGNGGSVYLLDWEAAREGSYTSRVIDAGQTVRWGTPRWVASGDGRLTFETRGGHAREPGDSWTEWTALEDGRVSGPPSRYLQWRVRMTSPARSEFRARGFGVPYRGPNRAPRIAEVEVSALAPEMSGGGRPATVRQTLPGGVQVDYSFSNATGEEPIGRVGFWARTLRSAAWEASDPDRDRLRYDLFLRAVAGGGFLPLERDLEETAFTWDAAGWADGWYELKVVARDEQDNAPEEALTATRLSAPFRIDNTPPELRSVAISATEEGFVLAGEAFDPGGRVCGLEFAIDGEPWRIAHPEDGILDGARESFRILLPTLRDGRAPSSAGVRVADEVGHIAVTRLPVPAP